MHEKGQMLPYSVNSFPEACFGFLKNFDYIEYMFVKSQLALLDLAHTTTSQVYEEKYYFCKTGRSVKKLLFPQPVPESRPAFHCAGISGLFFYFYVL